MRRALHFALLWLAAVPLLWGDAGVLIPRDKQQPDPSILSLEEMEITIRIDNGDARVFVREVFANHTNGIQEGDYVFALPGSATVSDFAVWDGSTRIPAVILERKRAEEIYNSLRWQSLDPGLLEMGERTAEEARRTAVFSAKIMPIPAYGTKRLEIEYHESIPVETLKSYFAIPLRPDAYHSQTAAHLWIHFELHSAHALKDVQFPSQLYSLQIKQQDAHTMRGEFEGRNVDLAEDFSVRYNLDSAHADSLEVLTYRNPNPGEPNPTEMAPVQGGPEPGFFEASALLGMGQAGGGATAGGPPRTVLALFDTSLSMQWEKLDRNYEALDKLLRSLRPTDKFNLLLFNTEVTPFAPAPVAADPATVQKALDSVKASRLRGGTNVQAALSAALDQARQSPGAYLVLLSDAGATRGTIQNGKLAAWYAAQWQQLPENQRPHTYIFAVGDDANMPLVKLLSRQEGVQEWVRSTEPIDFKLTAFLSKIGRDPIAGLHLDASPASNFDMVYPLQEAPFSGSMASWIGQYKAPAKSASFVAQGVRDGQPLEMKATHPLPEQDLEHPQLPRLWARARVDALLEKIEREGEDKATIDEIIRLARKYKFVTPYTSFLAVPRALLRPRVMRPGDPVLRVRTDPSIVSVVALFPFGLVKPLRYLPDEDTWQTRFLAPPEMNDGTYRVRLVLRDNSGHVYRESKSFVILSKPPVVRVRLDQAQVHRGQTVMLRASASSSTRTVVARLPGASPVYLHWSDQAGANTGELVIPDYLPAGKYTLTVTAEDIAHNIGSQEVALEVLP